MRIQWGRGARNGAHRRVRPRHGPRWDHPRPRPAADLYSVRVLGPALKGGGNAFLTGLEWAVAHGMDVINLSLSTRKQEFVPALHELADRAYFQGTVLVAAANNVPVHTYPWLFSSVVSVASHAERDPYTFYYNPNPPVEFTAPGAGLMAG